MNGMKKIGSGMYIIVIGALILASALTLVRNPYKSYYQREEPVSYQEAVESYGDKVGYPAGDDIPIAKSIEDIMNNEYCTIEVSKQNIESTRVFLIKDVSESGTKSSKIGRKYTSSTVHEAYSTKFNITGNIKYAIRQILWNVKNTSYGEWCVVTLESGERILVLIDLKILDISDNKIMLPIGEVVSNFTLNSLQTRSDYFEVEKENISWYINMVGDWEEREVGDINVMLRFGICWLILVPILLFGAYKYLVKKGYWKSE